ncbi:MAG TPA: hypothetical protein ENJ79_01825 [Gammaproteobacteria bacterium]|nr:hypothetical protein [Gammaproteobacteria bacterium]
MTLIVTLLGILADRVFPRLSDDRRFRRLLDWHAWIRARLERQGDWPVAILSLFPFWLAVLLVQGWLGNGLAGLVFQLLVLVWCLGPRDLAADVATWLEVAAAGDSALRGEAAARLLDGMSPATQGAPVPERIDQTRIAHAVLVAGCERLFGALFWFALFGPVGAVAWRSVAVLYRASGTGQADKAMETLYSLLLWLPARLLATGYALVGHFDAAFEGWREAHRRHPEGAAGSLTVLAETGLGALAAGVDGAGDDSGLVRSAMRLVWRSLVIWLVVLSLLTLAGWGG